MKTVHFQKLIIKIDRPKGFVQRGKDKDGKAWERTYLYDYGYLPKTQGGDGEGIDVFVGPHAEEDEAHWVMQKKDDGSFDEYKVLLGFKSRADARKAYLQHIPSKYLGGMVTMKLPLMRAMLGLEPGTDAAKTAGFFRGLSQSVGTAW